MEKMYSGWFDMNFPDCDEIREDDSDIDIDEWEDEYEWDDYPNYED